MASPTPDRPPERRRRRALGPAGSVPAAEVDRLALQVGPPALDEAPSVDDDDERLRRDVPPHHGG